MFRASGTFFLQKQYIDLYASSDMIINPEDELIP